MFETTAPGSDSTTIAATPPRGAGGSAGTLDDDRFDVVARVGRSHDDEVDDCGMSSFPGERPARRVELALKVANRRRVPTGPVRLPESACGKAPEGDAPDFTQSRVPHAATAASSVCPRRRPGSGTDPAALDAGQDANALGSVTGAPVMRAGTYGRRPAPRAP